MNRVARLMPIVTWLPQYERTWLPLDVIAGLTVAPQFGVAPERSQRRIA